MGRRLEEETLLEKLSAHPEIRERMEVLRLSVLEEEGVEEEGELGDADAAELRLIDEMRQMGRASLSAWAARKAERETASCRGEAGVYREGKKTLLAHDLRRHKRCRSSAPQGHTPAASVCERSESSSSERFASPATGR